MSKSTKQNLIIALVGHEGRMGQAIIALAKDHGVEIKGGLEQAAKDIDLVVDFSSPEGLSQAIQWCVKNRKPLVSGTTGLKDAGYKALKTAAQKIPVLHAPNMSLGIAVMSAMLEKFEALGDWDFHIDEVHHNQKKDKPSGTALLLDQKLSATLKRKLPPPNSIRGGGVPGIHQVWAMGPEEVLVLQHTAFDRKVFARGALKAARWLFDKGQPGLYDITDLFTFS